MAEKQDGPSKLFIVLVVSLSGLLILGIVGIIGVGIFRINMAQQTIAAQPTSTLIVKLPPVTPTPNPLTPTDTPAPTPTNTPVVQSGSQVEPASANKGQTDEVEGAEEDATDEETETDDTTKNAVVDGSATPKPSPTPTKKADDVGGGVSANDASTASSLAPANGEKTTAATVPDTGLGAFETILITLGLVTVLIAARRLRLA